MKKIIKQAERNLLIILLFIPITGNLLLNVVSDFSIVDDLSFENLISVVSFSLGSFFT